MVWSALAARGEWHQDGGDAQRTSFTAEEPELPWTLAWTWNGPDARGGAGGHRYHQPQPHTPWEARICTGGTHVYAPAGTNGLFALRKTDGTVAWQFREGACEATPAYDAADGSVLVGTGTGTLFKLDAATGKITGQFAADGPLHKSVLLAGGHAYALTDGGVLHKVDVRDMKPVWTYRAGAAAQTLPAFSTAQQMVIFCTADLRVHGVNAADGRRKWAVKPTPLAPGDDVEFTGGWPVVAEKRGVVFVRLLIGGIDTVLWSGGGPHGKWPTNNAAIRQRLVENPRWKNLFALRLEDGAEAFVPAVGPAGVEDLRAGRPRLRVPEMPVVKNIGDREVAYLQWRNGDTRDPKWDGRWDSHLGELVLDDATVPGCAAGDARFVQFQEHGGWVHVTDESCPLSMAGQTLFYAHWDMSQSARLTDRSPALGRTRAAPIKTEARPPVVRHLRLAADDLDPATHWTKKSMTLMDGRYFGGPGWWTYANVLDPPTPARDAYSEGILPRFTCVSDGLIIVQGNGGELFVLRHGGKSGRR